MRAYVFRLAPVSGRCPIRSALCTWTKSV
jgi:hypothetical protein